ncbi:hypothetical protein [Tenacibaculum maritimum]|uniref:hypothetical protein n=1 Tax=Tenacibaculum maritimum TaxID=107401 RepID=UPI0023075785|nr:hypothetical protein [Tenacibaculum maritimum]MDB0600397.1 hypothetical protein [Tenacibaculum maritimum]MDB0610552.1 hypothetical protein [Tenacibaculum maritimum]
MKIIKPEDFPIKMTEENINIIANMKLMFPESLCYNEILPFLSFDDKILISNKVRDINEEKERERLNSLTPEEQAEEKRKIEKNLQEGPEVFKGNILQQEWDSMWLEEIEKEKQAKKNKKSKE